MAVTTTAAWKTWRGYAGTDYDTTVDAIIPRVQAEMERFLGTKLDEATYTDEAIDGRGTANIYTRNWPIVAFSALKTRSGSTTATVDAATYRVATGEHSVGKIANEGSASGAAFTSTDGLLTGARRVPSFEAGYQNYLATYTAGYGGVGELSIAYPADLVMAAFYLIDHHLGNRGRSLGVSAQAMGNENLTFRSPEESMRAGYQLLGQFKRGII